MLEKGYHVFGTYRRLSTPNFWRLQFLNIFDEVNLISADLLDSPSIFEAIITSQPNEIYHLAAQSFVGASFEQPIATGEVTGLGVVRLLEAVKKINPEIRIYQASTSELYGNGSEKPMSEASPFCPSSPYAASKLYSYWINKIYREGYNMFTCNGILFNHESPIRGLEFVTRKISNGVARIALGLDNELSLGNIEAKRDWGYAPEYVEAMWRILQQDEPDDYVIATNETHSVKEFLIKAFEYVNLEWEKHVKIDGKLHRPLDVKYLQGDYTKSSEILGWNPLTKFNRLVEIMVHADLKRWEMWLKGEKFPWDAPFYPNDNKIIPRTWRLERR